MLVYQPAWALPTALTVTETAQVTEFVSRVQQAGYYVAACKSEYAEYAEEGADCVALYRKVRILNNHYKLMHKIDPLTLNFAVAMDNSWADAFEEYYSIVREHSALVKLR